MGRTQRVLVVVVVVVFKLCYYLNYVRWQHNKTKTYTKYKIKVLFESINHYACLFMSRVDLEHRPVKWVLSPNIMRVLWNYVSIKCAQKHVWGKQEVNAQVLEENSENKLFVRQKEKIYSTEFRINETNFIFRLQIFTVNIYCVLPFYGTAYSIIEVPTFRRNILTQFQGRLKPDSYPYNKTN
jgi:hypothetical protein